MKKILITGGTGSLGKAIAKVLLEEYELVEDIRIFSRDVGRQIEMQRKFPQLKYIPGDIRDYPRLLSAMAGCDAVFHTAALKYVNICEENPTEAQQVNVIGSLNVCLAAIKAGITKVVNISSDKAVNYSSTYGFTKAQAEDMFKAYGFMSCRFGNFIGSEGSVIPLFRKQAEQGKLILTDKRMVRYWITLDDGARFAANRLLESNGGEVFVPKMSSLKLTELAEIVAPGVEQVETGLRPGERLEEEIMTEEEWKTAEEEENYYVIR